ncbi:uncharacterized protein LOC134293153 [Anolis carolinensis]|uniref:uncharacterized protein LOC134293153 n=1 Tax=Anolis carolinensis TaxID=28377 RepID=UPI002F2B8950
MQIPSLIDFAPSMLFKQDYIPLCKTGTDFDAGNKRRNGSISGSAKKPDRQDFIGCPLSPGPESTTATTFQEKRISGCRSKENSGAEKHTMESAMNAFLLAGILLFVPGSYGQEVTGTTEGSSYLQPWLVGLAAVVVFLGVIFVASLVNRIFFANKTKDDQETGAETDVELRPTSRTVYDNLAVEVAEDGHPSSSSAAEAKVTDGKQTAM